MKKLLFLPLVLISCLCFAQDAKEIIGKPIKIGNLLVAQHDFPKTMNWNDAKVACTKLGKGWRLPNKNELNTMYINRDKIGGFARGDYWRASESNSNIAWGQRFIDGRQDRSSGENDGVNVRAVRSL